MKQDCTSTWRLGAYVLALTLALVGCGGGKNPEAQASPQETLAQLEVSGALPQLERLPILEGIDANRNGVRDDIETHIHRKYTDPAQRKAAMQMARAFQRMLLVDKHDFVALDAVSGEMMRAVVCSTSAFPVAGKDGDAMIDELRSITTNTKSRLQAYLAYNKARSGSVLTLSEGPSCE